MRVFCSSGFESVEEFVLRDEGKDCIFRDVCIWKQVIFVFLEMGFSGGVD